MEREVAPRHFGAGADDPALVGLITGYGKTRESWQQSDVKAAVTQLLVEEMGVPVDGTSAAASRNKGVVLIDRGAWRRRGYGPAEELAE